MRRMLIMLAFVLLAMFVVAGCTNTAGLEEAQKKITELDSENAMLKTKVAELETKIAEMEAAAAEAAKAEEAKVEVKKEEPKKAETPKTTPATPATGKKTRVQ